MRKKTNFEQVPLEVVKRVVEEQVKQEETSEAPTAPFGSQQAPPQRKEGVTAC